MITKNDIEKAYKVFGALLEKYAQERFNTIIRPWCIKKGYRFTSGMGTWCFYDIENERTIFKTEVPAFFYSVLEEYIREAQCQLFELLPDYDPDIDRANNGLPDDPAYKGQK